LINFRAIGEVAHASVVNNLISSQLQQEDFPNAAVKSSLDLAASMKAFV